MGSPRNPGLPCLLRHTSRQRPIGGLAHTAVDARAQAPSPRARTKQPITPLQENTCAPIPHAANGFWLLPAFLWPACPP